MKKFLIVLMIFFPALGHSQTFGTWKPITEISSKNYSFKETDQFYTIYYNKKVKLYSLNGNLCFLQLRIKDGKMRTVRPNTKKVFRADKNLKLEPYYIVR